MPATNDRRAWHRIRGLSAAGDSSAQQGSDNTSTSEDASRFERYDGPPKITPPSGRPLPPRPKEGEKPPEPIKKPIIKTNPGSEL